MARLYNILSRYQRFFLGAAIFLCFLAVSIKVERGSVDLILRDNPIIAVLLISVGLLGAWVYIAIDKYKIRKLSGQILEGSKKETDFAEKLKELTERQEEIYHLIIDGKSNKEICALLFIEPSTLKTHINQIYKKLNVESRRQLKNVSKASN